MRMVCGKNEAVHLLVVPKWIAVGRWRRKTRKTRKTRTTRRRRRRKYAVEDQTALGGGGGN